MENPKPTEEEQEQVGTPRHAEEDDMRGGDAPDADTPGRTTPETDPSERGE